MAVRLQAARDRDDAGVTAVEYGLMIAVLVAIIVAAATALGGGITAAFDAAAEALTP
ncbi:Flp family type IVb pilin [Thermomonospora echinospora]|uniref:Flp family type IVb pilin n=1 Tax=Thermomonospora echinospora TaxID=1992 RepID=UPI00190ECD2C|nr:Flp family type IVb pilin [Thermomonospora echinospora]